MEFKHHTCTCKDGKLCWFKQDETLLPIPAVKENSESELYKLVTGVHLGDSVFDQMPASEIARVACGEDLRTSSPRIWSYNEALEVPSWVERSKVERAQALIQQYYFAFNVSLTMELLMGFSIGRFAEVLVLAGYTRSDKTTFDRFKHTALAMHKWLKYDLFDPVSKARTSLMQVRAMHSLARRMAKTIWEKEKEVSGMEIGVPLSQYDLALTQLGFSTICLDVIETDLNVALSEEDQEAWIHTWRFIGYLLGIEDDFNACTSQRKGEILMQEFYSWVPVLTAHHRRSSLELYHATVRGIGTYTGLGVNLLAALMFHHKRSWVDASWAGITPSESSVRFCRFMLYLLSTFPSFRRCGNLWFISQHEMTDRLPYLKAWVELVNAKIWSPLHDISFFLSDLAIAWFRYPRLKRAGC